MMSAQDYRARADALESTSLECVDYDLILEIGATAAQWRKLADLADLQDAMLRALQATREGPSPSTLVDTRRLGRSGN